MQDGPLDMRMNPSSGITAREWLNSATEAEIADTLYKYGEERFSRKIARDICLAREFSDISTTGQLAEIIKKANPAWEKEKHPATRSFQAIRIAVNRELDELKEGIEAALPRASSARDMGARQKIVCSSTGGAPKI